MEHLVRDPTPLTRVYHLMAEGTSFKVTVALRARRVEKWNRGVKRDYLDNAPIKYVGLDCEFTNPREVDQRIAVLQLSVASENLVFQICRADQVPQALKEFLQDGSIRLHGSAIGKDVEMLIPGTNLEKKKRNKNKKKDTAQEKEDDELIFGWANVPFSFKQVRCAAMDARLGFEMARSY
ncbi:uncharacterized protein [Lolium perenne]|uniref:uncharacterized protein n=1 Tax=Lolium perenne TaxID=4522 RepID=UPI0021F636D6|nr:uncharacterized protein LOC127329460 [Lolium perenne]